MDIFSFPCDFCACLQWDARPLVQGDLFLFLFMWELQPSLTHNGCVRPLECGMRWLLGEQSNQFATDRVKREQSDDFWSFLCESESPAAVGFQPICSKFWRRSRNSNFDTMLLFSVSLREFCRAEINLGLAFSSLSPNAHTSLCFALAGRQRNPPRWAIAQDNIYHPEKNQQTKNLCSHKSLPSLQLGKEFTGNAWSLSCFQCEMMCSRHLRSFQEELLLSCLHFPFPFV